MLDERKAAILRAVVEEYIETAQPVGSSHVASAPGVDVSSATVRNEMAGLEAEGYLRQPHTSAGRVPTEKGYRFFVDNLRPPTTLGITSRSPSACDSVSAATVSRKSGSPSEPGSFVRSRTATARALAGTACASACAGNGRYRRTCATPTRSPRVAR